MQSVCVAFKAHLGWVNAVVVDIRSATPNPIHALRIDLLDGKDRETLEPYHVAGGWSGLKQVQPPSNPALVIRRGRRKQVAAAKKRLMALRESLEREQLEWSRAGALSS